MEMKIDCGGLFTIGLTLLFITLKMVGVIDWSWWWVLSPIWISLALVLLVIIVFVVTGVAIELLETKQARK